MTKKQKLDVDRILRAGLDVINTPSLATHRYYLEQYLHNYLRIYKTGWDVLARKILFYQDLHDGKPRALAMSAHILPEVPDFKERIIQKIKELDEKKAEWKRVAENLPNKLPHLTDDDKEFRKELQSLESSWYTTHACQCLGMCVCEISLYPPYQSTCLPSGKDFSILR